MVHCGGPMNGCNCFGPKGQTLNQNPVILQCAAARCLSEKILAKGTLRNTIACKPHLCHSKPTLERLPQKHLGRRGVDTVLVVWPRALWMVGAEVGGGCLKLVAEDRSKTGRNGLETGQHASKTGWRTVSDPSFGAGQR